MIVTVRVTTNFKRQAKPLLKKYISLREELVELENKLKENPKLGTPLGKSTYKIRLKVKSKGKGKSGGLRVISLIEEEIIGFIETFEKETIVYLLSIYDKSQTSSLTNKELKDLIKDIH